MTFKLSLAIASAAFLSISSSAQVIDPKNDFISTYAGAKNGDVDVLSTNVVFNGSTFFLTATMDGAIGTTSGALYVWGFNRGTGTARFASIGITNVLFDSVITLRPDTTASITRIGGTTTNLPVGTVTITGNTLSAAIAGTELPSTGLPQASFTWNLWPRVGTGNNNQISDFAPDNSNAPLTVAPEPSTLVFLGLGLPLWRSLRRRTR